MAAVAIYSGTFDPFTLGHADLATRAAKIFDRLIIAVAAFPGSSKQPLFNTDERSEMVKSSLSHIKNIEIIRFDSLLAHFAKEHGASVIVRGLRAVADYEYETTLAEMNRHLGEGLETMYLSCDQQYSHISSSLIKEVASLGGDIACYLHPEVHHALMERITQRS